MEREKLRTSSRTLYMSLLLPDRRPTVTDDTHVHIEGLQKLEASGATTFALFLHTIPPSW